MAKRTGKKKKEKKAEAPNVADEAMISDDMAPDDEGKPRERGMTEIRRLRRSFGAGFLGKDSPLIKTVVSKIEEMHPHLFGKEEAVHTAASKAFEDWFDSEGNRRLVEDAVKKQIEGSVGGLLQERLEAMHEELVAKLDETLREAGFLTAEFVEMKLNEQQTSTTDMIEDLVEQALNKKFTEMKLVTTDQLALAGEGGGGLDEEAVNRVVEDLVNRKLADLPAGGGEGGPAIDFAKVEELVNRQIDEAGFVRLEDLAEKAADEDMAEQVSEKVAETVAASGFVTQEELADKLQGVSVGDPSAMEERVRSSVEEHVGSVLAEEAKELIVRIKQDLKSAIDEKVGDFAASDSLKAVVTGALKSELAVQGLQRGEITEEIQETIKVAVSGAFSSSLFTDAVARTLEEQGAVGGGGGGAGVNEDAVRNIVRTEGKKVTEEILLREAQGLVKQVKIEVGKVQKKVEESQGLTPEDLAKVKEEVEASFGVKIEQFFDSPEFKDLVGSMAEERAAGLISSADVKTGFETIAKKVMADNQIEAGALPSPAQLESLIGSAIQSKIETLGGGGGADPETVRNIVDETLKAALPDHVGKFLDEKLPPPEYFESLATLSQVREEMEKRMSGSSSGMRGGGGGGGAFAGSPGDSAVFTNLITRILGSDDLKEMIDDKFKVINNYIKNELVPKVVKKTLKKEGFSN